MGEKGACGTNRPTSCVHEPPRGPGRTTLGWCRAGHHVATASPATQPPGRAGDRSARSETVSPSRRPLPRVATPARSVSGRRPRRAAEPSSRARPPGKGVCHTRRNGPGDIGSAKSVGGRRAPWTTTSHSGGCHPAAIWLGACRGEIAGYGPSLPARAAHGDGVVGCGCRPQRSGQTATPTAPGRSDPLAVRSGHGRTCAVDVAGQGGRLERRPGRPAQRTRVRHARRAGGRAVPLPMGGVVKELSEPWDCDGFRRSPPGNHMGLRRLPPSKRRTPVRSLTGTVERRKGSEE